MPKTITQLIWMAVAVHFVVLNPITLSANLKYEKNRTIAQAMAIGLSNQYQIERDDVEKILCFEPTGYNNKLETFMELVRLGAEGSSDPEVQDFYRRYQMCSRYIRRRYEVSYNKGR